MQSTERQVLPIISAGVVIGLLQLFMALSFAALIFSGALSAYIAEGIGLAIMGTIVAGVIIAVFTSLPGTVGGSQGVPAAITGVMAASIAGSVASSGGSGVESFITVAAAIAVTTLLTGLFFWGLGRFQLGGLVRFLPYPVVGGFLAGTGWLLVTGALGMMVDLPSGLGRFPLLFQADALMRWLPGVLLALAMLLATRRSDHFLILPAFMIGALLLFFAAARLSGISPAELGAQGWLLGPFPEGGVLWRPLTPAALAQVNWGAILAQTANIIAIMAVSAVSLLLNAGGLELATNRDLEVNHELQVAGVANLAAGLGAGLVGYKQLSLSTLHFKLGGSSRLSGVIAAGVCAVVLIAGGSALAYFPKMVVGALLLLLGFNFLFDWVIAGLFRLPKIDYAIVLVILVVTIIAGFLEAVALGLLLAVILFVVSYSRVDVVRHELSGGSYQSRVTRPRVHGQALAALGERLYILQLQGFIFFGTANNLLNQLRARIQDPQQEKPQAIVLDFQRVTGLDSTAMLSFTRMKQMAENEEITLAITSPNARVLSQLEQGGLADEGETVRFFESLDQGVEVCENQLLAWAQIDKDEAPSSLVNQLQEILAAGADAAAGEHAVLQDLLQHMTLVEVEAEQLLMAEGQEANDVYFVDSGLVTAQICRPGQAPIRLETSGTGSVIGEIGFYLGQARTADVIADTPGRVYRLSTADLQKLEETNPEAASLLHQIIVHLLADRVIRLTNAVKALER